MDTKTPGIADLLLSSDPLAWTANLDRIDAAAANCREVALCGLHGTGRLLWLAAQDQEEGLDAETLGDAARLVMYLAQLLAALDEVQAEVRLCQ